MNPLFAPESDLRGRSAALLGDALSSTVFETHSPYRAIAMIWDQRIRFHPPLDLQGHPDDLALISPRVHIPGAERRSAVAFGKDRSQMPKKRPRTGRAF